MLVSVAVPAPLPPLTYDVPDHMAANVVPGSRVVVPLRGRRELGVVLGPAEPREGIRPRAIVDAPDATPMVDASMLSLCGWIASYYAAPIGLVLKTALPASLTAAGRPEPGVKVARHVELTRIIGSITEREAEFKRAPKQRELYELIESLGGSASVELITERHGFAPPVLTALAKRGLVAVRRDTVHRDPFADRAPPADPRHTATAGQAGVIAALRAAPAGHIVLLHGVTGSGKTLVYLEYLRTVLASGKGAIVLVPEIALTPQTVGRFRAVFGDTVAVLHSTLSDGERFDAWSALRRGERRIAVGARSAVFAPIADLGAIVIDEEHEPSYKQNEAPRYHAREVAIVRAREQGAVVVLGSATPSLESWANARSGKYHLMSLPDRVGGGRLPAVRVVDMRRKAEGPPGASRPPKTPHRFALSEALEDALRDRLQRGEQSILLLNRRGYSAFLQCQQCGQVDACPNCSVSLVVHRTPERLVCHHCRHVAEVRTACTVCGGPVMRERGFGTQQVERLLGDVFPAARIARMDLDTTSGKWSHAAILDRVGRGEVDILLGTQMIAKGLDFANVTLVGVVDADVGINLPDFRASERCFQLLSQVAGRAGRGTKSGEVIIQTRVPGHHAVQCAVSHDYVGFVTRELEGRREPPYPPTVRIANVVFSGTGESETVEFAMQATDALRERAARSGTALEIVGPAPCPIDRVRGRWRWHVLLKSTQPADLTRAGRWFTEGLKVPARGNLRVIVDRDPASLL